MPQRIREGRPYIYGGKSYVEVSEPGPMGGIKKYRTEYGKVKPRKLLKRRIIKPLRRGRFPALKKGTAPRRF